MLILLKDKGDNMRTLNKSKFGLIIFLTLLISIQVAKSISISQPAPIDLKLNRGDTARFYSNIQTMGSSVKQSCSVSANGMEPLIITFDEKEVVIDPEGKKYIFGYISVPDNAPVQIYKGKILVGCKPEVKEGEGGSSIIQQNMFADFIVEVVAKPEERLITPVPEEKREAFPLPFIIIVIVLILAIIGYYFSKKSEKKIIS